MNELALKRPCPICKKIALRFDGDDVHCTACATYQKRGHWPLKIRYWTVGRKWWWRVPIMIWFLYILVRMIHDPSYAGIRMSLSNPFGAFDLGIHELGHMLFEPFGEFMHILGGSLFQCLFPLMCLVSFLQIRYYFAASMCWCWLGINLYDVAVYAADARLRILPLALGPFGIGEDEISAYEHHDWYQILDRTHHLRDDLKIAHGMRIAGIVVFIFGLSLGVYLLINMAARRFAPPLEKPKTDPLEYRPPMY